MPNHLDLVHASALDVREHGLVLALRVGSQRVAVLFEVEHEMRGQNRLCGQRVAEDFLYLRLVNIHRRGDAAFNFSGRIWMVQQDRLLAVLDRHRTRAAVRIWQDDEERLAAGTRRQQQKKWNQNNSPQHQRLSLTSIANRVPRTPSIAVGVLIFIAPGELRAISPEIIETVPRFMSASIEPLKLLELNL